MRHAELRGLRQRACLSQVELARKAGVSQQYVSKVERGIVHVVNPQYATRLRDACEGRPRDRKSLSAEALWAMDGSTFKQIGDAHGRPASAVGQAARHHGFETPRHRMGWTHGPCLSCGSVWSKGALSKCHICPHCQKPKVRDAALLRERIASQGRLKDGIVAEDGTIIETGAERQERIGKRCPRTTWTGMGILG